MLQTFIQDSNCSNGCNSSVHEHKSETSQKCAPSSGEWYDGCASLAQEQHLTVYNAFQTLISFFRQSFCLWYFLNYIGEI